VSAAHDPDSLGGHGARGDRGVGMDLRLHGDRLAAPGLLDFAVSLWPGERPAALRGALEAALHDVRYPDDREARAALAARHGRSPEEVLALNGACEAFWLIAHALRPRVAACVHPSFTEPEAALRASGAEVLRVARDPRDWSFDPAAVPARADLVVLGNPNNPTGALDPPEAVLSLVRPGRLVVVDEAFMDFVAGQRASLARRAQDGLVVVRSMTKLWSLAGVRVGYLLAAPDLVAALEAQRQPWSVNAPALAALTACTRDAATPRRVAWEVASARVALQARLSALPGVRVWPGEANFLLLEVPDGPATIAALAAAGVAVRPASSFPGLTEDHLRVAVRRPAENERLVAGLAEALGG
jgi:histidinol-phosphate/aromatic aminotransferase/cobyric acid decarboxylase-like protein